MAHIAGFRPGLSVRVAALGVEREISPMFDAFSVAGAFVVGFVIGVLVTYRRVMEGVDEWMREKFENGELRRLDQRDDIYVHICRRHPERS